MIFGEVPNAAAFQVHHAHQGVLGEQRHGNLAADARSAFHVTGVFQRVVDADYGSA